MIIYAGCLRARGSEKGKDNDEDDDNLMRILHFHCFFFYVWNDGNKDDFTDDKKNDNTDNGNDDNKSFDDNDGNDDSKIYCGNDNKSYDAIDDLKSYDDNDDNNKHGNHTEITPRP